MVFSSPTWFEGLFFYASVILIPLIISIGICLIGFIKNNRILKFLGVIFIIISLLVCIPLSSVLWHYEYEVPSVQSKIVTVDSWQPKAGIQTNENGMMVIDNADQLMLITTEGEAFLNEENFLFQKFDTRDILNNAKPGSVIKITSYGWREGFNSGFPNILNITVIDDSNATNVNVGDYFGTKLV